MELGVILGFVVGVGALVVANLAEGGSIASLFQFSAMLIIFGGTIGATMISTGLGGVRGMPATLAGALRKPATDPEQLLETLVAFAQRARREGLLALEDDVRNLKDPFMAKGLQMVVDGIDPEMVEGVLFTEADLEQQKTNAEAGVFETAGGFAPTMGIIGTVMGLIVVLSNLSNPDELGHSIAVAFLATLWGIMSANIFFLPVANKVKANARAEAHLRHMVIEGILSIQKGDSPTMVKEKLNAFLAGEGKKKKAQAPEEGRAGALAPGEERA